VDSRLLKISIQARDLELLGLLLHTRILTLFHASILVFGGKKEAAKKRIQKLKAGGLILERRRKAYEQGVLFLSKKGFECLKIHGALPAECPNIRSFSKRGQISELTLRHELEVLDVKTAFHREIARHDNLSIAEFSTWPRLYEFTVRDEEKRTGSKTVQPDGFIRIHERDAEGALWEHMFFLEVDRSTEKLFTFIGKIDCYSLFYRQGGMAERLGQRKEEYKNFPFRVLMLCKTDERVQTIARGIAETSKANNRQVLVSRTELACQNPFELIWKNLSTCSENFSVGNTSLFFDTI